MFPSCGVMSTNRKYCYCFYELALNQSFRRLQHMRIHCSDGSVETVNPQLMAPYLFHIQHQTPLPFSRRSKNIGIH
ncbi:unnamed protein product [Ixodes pacificus]